MVSVARRLVLAAVLLLGILATPAGAEDGWRPLSAGDIERYREIFALQEDGKWSEADRLIGALENKVLLGYVLEQRYMHPTAYRSSFPELSRWLSAYGDHPHAEPIYRLAKRRQGSAAEPQRYATRRWRAEPDKLLPPELVEDNQTASDPRAVSRIYSRLRYLTSEGRATQALNYLNDPAQFNRLTAAQTDRVRGWIAAAYYYEGELTKASRVAETALDRDKDAAVLSHWISGLIAMRRNDPGTAYQHFAAQAAVEHQEAALRSAGAFWASRTALAAGHPEAVMSHLELAADYPLTFYGQIALEQLGRASGLDWTGLALTDETYATLAARSPRIARAAALAQVGKITEAELELRWAHGELTAEEDPALVALAAALNLPTSQIIIANHAAAGLRDGGPYLAAMYPAPDFTPTGGFEVDKAVLFGLIRQESKFLPEAESRVGARGLMQLMPRTASYVAGTSRASRRLFDPEYNMQLGQSYVRQLLTRYNDGEGDLFEMALSYNWGPGNLRRWQTATGIEDDLLALESIPNAEARHFVEVVMTNIWLYRDRFGEASPSRAAVAAGARPIYGDLDRLK